MQNNLTFRRFFSVFLCCALTAMLLSACTHTISNTDNHTEPTVTIHNETSFDCEQISLTYNNRISQDFGTQKLRSTSNMPLDFSSDTDDALTSVSISFITSQGKTSAGSFSGIVPEHLSFTFSEDESGSILITSNIQENE